MTITIHDQDSAAALAEEVYAAYARVFDDAGTAAQWREQRWEPHRTRAGFRLATAHADGRLAGFSWGYTGEFGQWWSDWVAAALPEVGRDWIGGHFELVELGVLPEHRGTGLGTGLLSRVLAGLPHDRALLMTDADPNDPGHRLYAAHGWRVIGTMPTHAVVMGCELPT